MEAINSKISLSRKANKYLLEHCVSNRRAEVMAIGFTGYINGMSHYDTTLIRKSGKWFVFSTLETVLSIVGEVDCFVLTRNTILPAN